MQSSAKTGDMASALEARVSALVDIGVNLAAGSMLWPRRLKRLAVMSLDVCLAALAVWAAFSLRLGEFHVPGEGFALLTLAMTALWFPIALRRGTYRSIFRFAGRGAIVSLMVSAMLVTLPLIAGFTVVAHDGIPRTLAILAPLLFFMAVTLSRIVGRYVLVDLFSARASHANVKRVIIYGAGAAGQQLASSLSAEPAMRVVGFVDDDPAKDGHFLDGARVYHSSQTCTLVEQLGVTDIVIAITAISFARRKHIIAALEPMGVNVQTLPPVREVMDGRISAAALRPVAIEDLLGRAAVPEHGDLLSREISGKVVMVTGAGGSIGSEICRQVLAQDPAAMILVEANEFALFSIGCELEASLSARDTATRPSVYQRLADVSLASAVDRLFAEFTPHAIFHAAAYKHVPLVEENVLEAVRNNVTGTRLMAEAAQRHGVERFVLISTDKAVRPPNVMGASKRLCEVVLQDLARRRGAAIFAIVRFGNVLGSSGSVVPTFQRQIEAGGPVTVTDRKVTRYFMTIFEAAQLVIQAGAMARGGEVFLLDMGEPVKIWDLARSMVRLSGLSVRDAANPTGDIAIIESGLRPGEKLFEELLIDAATAATEHPRIMQGADTAPHAATVAQVLSQIEIAIARADVGACKRALRIVAPTLRLSAQERTARGRAYSRPAVRILESGSSRGASGAVVDAPNQQPTQV
ncbi:Polysaccharide biosynthesis protein CapD type [Erythrobacter sp. NAP1]|uniref:polysaccharide biosynthesis protein n=1 Tax=Erythrobacter sp. NAP1 TaxID=237727 RepID=UPI0000687729|nr:nucleoside-diphosphate sugar epimerase/dehydratase [Erythrobacter sp. NAP1]EAQ28452.1 Polysaccharide biosynthesis protein CapD type [Erythrobacter sp. NAP1]